VYVKVSVKECNVKFNFCRILKQETYLKKTILSYNWDFRNLRECMILLALCSD